MRTCLFPVATVTPCSICWTPPGSSAPPAPPARPGCRSPATSCSPWVCRSTRPVARATGLVLRHTHGEQDVAGLRHPGLAGGAGGALDPGGVQQIEQGVTVATGNKQVRIARQTPDAVTGLPVASHRYSESGILGATNQLVAQGNQSPGAPVS